MAFGGNALYTPNIVCMHRLAVLTFFAFLLPALAWGSGFALPNHAKTPGAIITTDTAKICASGYAHRVRHVPYAEIDRVYLAYGIPRGHRSGYVIDHLISLELGGSNEERNLWPQPRVEAKEKDRIEGELHTVVCSGHLPLPEAQARIAQDWRVAVPSR
jgi:hypothetical protein